MASQSQSLFDPNRATASGLYIKVNKLYSQKLTGLVLLFHGEAGITATLLIGTFQRPPHTSGGARRG